MLGFISRNDYFFCIKLFEEKKRFLFREQIIFVLSYRNEFKTIEILIPKNRNFKIDSKMMLTTVNKERALMLTHH